MFAVYEREDENYTQTDIGNLLKYLGTIRARARAHIITSETKKVVTALKGLRFFNM